MEKFKFKRSLYMEGAILLLIAGFISIIFFIFTYLISSIIIDNHFEREQIVQKNNDSYVEKLKQYIKQNDIATSDSEKLEKWVNSERIVMMKVFKDNHLVYDSEYDINDFSEEISLYDLENSYDIEFSDGTATVIVYVMYFYKIYTVALIAEIILSFILFISIILYGIRGKIQYILKLRDEVEILESGNLDYNITIKGRDELTELAKGLNSMRESIQNQIEQEEYLVETNKSLVTEISHDMRTPLTSIMLYAQILKSGKYKDEEQMNEYIDKILKKTNHMKNLSDHLFDYSLYAKESKAILESAEDIKIVLYDALSEICYYLEDRGYKIDTNLTWKNVKIKVNTEYICRIFDNISSNIIKYADKNRPVVIRCEYNYDEFTLTFENYCSIENEVEDSNNIGVHNIRNMMLSMNGYCRNSLQKDKYTISISFKTYNK